MTRRLALAAALVLGLGTVALAQTTEPELAIVDINASRYPDGGQTLMVVEFRNLPSAPDPAAIEVTVDGEPVADLEVATLADSQVPAGVVLVIDTSGSMSGAAIQAAKDAAKAFVAQKSPADLIALVTFSDTAVVQTGFTTNAGDLNARIDSIGASGETAFNDGVLLGLRLFESPSAANLVPSMIVLSDGEDTVSQATQAEAVAAVESSGVRVFGVALSSPDFNPEAVEAVATAGNGLFLSTPDPAQLSALYGQIGREINNTLVLRFISPVSTPGEATFAVTYTVGGLTASQVFPVSGYATTTTTSPVSTTVASVPPSTVVVESDLPLPARTLALIGALGLALTVFLFLLILFGREEETGGRRFAKRLAAYGRRGKPTAEEKLPLLQRIPLFSRVTRAAEAEVRRRGLLAGVNATLDQANIAMTAGEAIVAMFGLAAVGGVFVAIFNGPITGLIVGGVLLIIFYTMIRYAGGREKRKFEKQLPDTLTLLSTSLRAGYSLLQAVEAVASEAPEPTSREFSRAVAEARLGRSVSDALAGIVQRTQSEDFRWATMAIEIQREVGGNLAEVLQTVADTMLARNRIRGEIRALTAEGRISAVVLGVLPFGLTAFMWVNNRDYLEPLFQATFGRVAIVVGLVLIAIGIYWLKKIVDIDI